MIQNNLFRICNFKGQVNDALLKVHQVCLFLLFFNYLDSFNLIYLMYAVNTFWWVFLGKFGNNSKNRPATAGLGKD